MIFLFDRFDMIVPRRVVFLVKYSDLERPGSEKEIGPIAWHSTLVFEIIFCWRGSHHDDHGWIMACQDLSAGHWIFPRSLDLPHSYVCIIVYTSVSMYPLNAGYHVPIWRMCKIQNGGIFDVRSLTDPLFFKVSWVSFEKPSWLGIILLMHQMLFLMVFRSHLEAVLPFFSAFSGRFSC